MNFKDLVRLNNHIIIKDVYSEQFAVYGKVVVDYDFSELINFMEKETLVPDAGSIYMPSVPELERFQLKERLENEFYGEMFIQIGYCNGSNSTLNGLEYHKGSEINITVTDMVLLLGKLQDVKNNMYRTEKVDAFFVKKGIAIQIYETTLHFGPCKIGPEGFKCIVVLPKGTNEPLKYHKRRYSDKLLFARNKWLLAHPLRKQLIEKGAWPGIIGENIEIKIF